MGSFISFICGNRDRERNRGQQSERRNRRRNNSESLSEIRYGLNEITEETLIYRPNLNNFESTTSRSRSSSIDDNKMGIPLKRIQFKWRLSENISEEELKCKRDLFWETCMTYGGQEQVWSALKIVCQEISNDLVLAGSILDSCGIILPCGLLTEIYDEKGFRYHLPPYCVCDPVSTSGDTCDLVNEFKSKSLIFNEKVDKIKIRLSNGKDLLISFEDQQKVSDIKKYIRAKESVNSKQRMVMLWCGKVLDDGVRIGALNLPKGAVLQVMLPA